MATITVEPVRHKNVHNKESLYLRLKTVHGEYLMQVGKGSIEWVEEQIKKPEEGDQANGPELPFNEPPPRTYEEIIKEFNAQERKEFDKLWKQYEKEMKEADLQIGFDEWKKNKGA